ncbi:stalk domain-containing protein [Brevibacillus fluminis]|uniref:stalk domain-containing protein n=1 Tax=Brevibacillus fluminis TaxID=511487 RepID=UPI003F89CA5B
MMKKWLLTGLLACSLSSVAYADASGKPNGAAAAAGTEVYVPAQTVMQQYGVDLFYHYNSQMFLMMSGNNSVYFQVNQPVLYINGKQVRSGVFAKYENGALMIPASYLTDGLKIGVTPQGQDAQQKADAATTDGLFHKWQLFLPGIAWETHPNSGQSTVYQGADTLQGSLDIHADGTYEWISARDNTTITGAWTRTDSMEEPLLLLQGEGGDDYRIGIYKGALFIKAKSSGWLYYLSGKLLP